LPGSRLPVSSFTVNSFIKKDFSCVCKTSALQRAGVFVLQCARYLAVISAIKLLNLSLFSGCFKAIVLRGGGVYFKMIVDLRIRLCFDEFGRLLVFLLIGLKNGETAVPAREQVRERI
jgi:hypothetical protein